MLKWSITEWVGGKMNRIYYTVAIEHFARGNEMLFFPGPRQVGKTTVAEGLLNHYPGSHYLNWDTVETKTLILEGNRTLGETLKLNQLNTDIPLVVFDEIHKYPDWKNFLKGFFDLYKNKAHIGVTGSSKLDVYHQGGDSLMGRYMPYRMHPFSVAEILRTTVPLVEISPPQRIDEAFFEALWTFGGFPAPFLKADARFHQQWTNLRHRQLFREDIKDLTRIQEVGQLEILLLLLKEQVGKLLNRDSLATKLKVANQTIERWLCTLEAFYTIFRIKPWSTNVSRSLIKEPKVYLSDWSNISDVGDRAENFIACHLLKAVHFWTDMGYGEYELYFLRNKEKKEVDFLVVKNQKPWILVEAKYANNQSISEHLYYYQKTLDVPFAFQVIVDMPYVDEDCFAHTGPIKVPARTFLSQLI
jgi:predicted AAA+ superfamily ATPase